MTAIAEVSMPLEACSHCLVSALTNSPHRGLGRSAGSRLSAPLLGRLPSPSLLKETFPEHRLLGGKTTLLEWDSR